MGANVLLKPRTLKLVHRWVARGRGLLGRIRLETAGELGGMAVFVFGVWIVFPPAAVMLAGLGAIVYFQGRQPGGDEDEE